ncbi:Nin1 binding protein, partial [Rhizophlyctis rosea]
MAATTPSISHGRDTVQTLVLDTAPLIQTQPLVHLASHFITIPEVMREVRDARARQNLAVLPFEIEIKIPSEEAIAAVVAFSKKTGDYGVLSATDLKVLALTWMMEKEARGTAHLRTEPVKATTQTGGGKKASGPKAGPGASAGGEMAKEEAGSVAESSNVQTQPDVVVDSVDADEPTSVAEVDAKRLEEEATAAWGGEDHEEEEEEEEEDAGDGEGEPEVEEAEEPLTEEDTPADPEPTDSEIAEAQAHLASLSASRSTDQTSPPADSASAEPEDDGEGAWITPKNVQRHKAKDLYGQGKKKKKAEVIPVACITSDFAMQNVLLQMNLRLLSVDGVSITRLKHFVLRCHACFKTTKEMSKKFCPHCGNATLIRTSISISQSGETTFYLKKNFQYNLRGTKYSIPQAQGGRNNNDLILREDQKEYQKALQGQRRKKEGLDVFDVDYVPLEARRGK